MGNDPLIPIIFELSSWNRNQSIYDWIKSQLKEVYTVPLDVGQHWLDNQQIIPLLDGLDELGSSEYIKQCVDAINRFIEGGGYPYLVVMLSS